MSMWTRFAKDVFRGDWKLAWTSWAAAIGTLVYVVSPIDFVPELLLPLVGYVDDLGVIGVMTLLLTREKARWEESIKAGAIDIQSPQRQG